MTWTKFRHAGETSIADRPLMVICRYFKRRLYKAPVTTNCMRVMLPIANNRKRIITQLRFYMVRRMKSFWKYDLYILLSIILDVRAPSYLLLTRSISWLLMTWLLPSPGHQHPWYWFCRIGTSLSYTGKDFNNLYHASVKEWLGT